MKNKFILTCILFGANFLVNQVIYPYSLDSDSLSEFFNECKNEGIDITLIVKKDNPPAALLKNLWDRSILLACHIHIMNQSDISETCGIDYKGRLKKQDGFLEEVIQSNVTNCSWEGPSSAHVQCVIGRKVCISEISIDIT